MGKRFTETTKWADTWFRGLPAQSKLGWIYLCDNCDNAGVNDLDRELANFQIRDTLDWDALIEAAGERITRLKSGKLWLTRFIRFQYGASFPMDCKQHGAVLVLLEGYAKSERVIRDFLESLKTLQEKEKETDTEKEKDSGKGERGKPKRKQILAADVPVPERIDTPEVRQAISDWLDYKTKNGKPYKDAAFLGRKVAEYAAGGPAAFVAAVNSSIGSNYDGIYPAKGNNGSPPTSGPHRHRG